MKRSMKIASRAGLTGVALMFFAAQVTAQPPGGMGQGRGMGMGGGMMMEQHMKMMDQDGDGKLSQEEFMTYHEKRFKQMDADGDGYVDADEFAQAMRAMKQRMKGGMMSAPMQKEEAQGGQPAQQ